MNVGPLSNIGVVDLKRGLEVDHSTLNRWVLAYAPLIGRRLRRFRKPQLSPSGGPWLTGML